MAGRSATQRQPRFGPEPRDMAKPDLRKGLAATIDTSLPFAIGGASFGGMVALELARHLRPTAVILIASCRSPLSLPPHYRQLSWLTQFLPAAMLIGALARSRVVTSRFGLKTRDERRLFGDMLRATPPSPRIPRHHQAGRGIHVT